MARWSRGRVRVVPLAAPEAEPYLGHLSPADRFDQAWLSAGDRLFAGHAAVWEAVYRLPGGRLLRPLRWLPGFNLVSHRLYRFIADHRPRSCRVRR